MPCLLYPQKWVWLRPSRLWPSFHPDGPVMARVRSLVILTSLIEPVFPDLLTIGDFGVWRLPAELSAKNLTHVHKTTTCMNIYAHIWTPCILCKHTYEYVLFVNAGSRTCQPNEFRCNNGQCVDKDRLCAGFITCRDGSFKISNETCG